MATQWGWSDQAEALNHESASRRGIPVDARTLAGIYHSVGNQSLAICSTLPQRRRLPFDGIRARLAVTLRTGQRV